MWRVLDATEGAITRVGTNIYSAPEHNPLMQTGQLDTGGLRLPQDQLSPAADIYSLAKTTYTLLAGESPRRFAQHALTELPVHLRDTVWANSVLRVLEKATQSRPEAVTKQSKSSGTILRMQACLRLGRCRWFPRICRYGANQAQIFRLNRKKSSPKLRRHDHTFAVPDQRESVLRRSGHRQTPAHRCSD